MKRHVPIILLVTLWVVFFGRQIAGGEVWYCCDNLLINVPSKVFLVRELLQGTIPVSNPYIFSGSPFWADINLAILHPNTLLYFFSSPFRALTIGIVASYLVALTGMYALGRVLRFGVFASVLGAIVFGFSGTLVVYANNIAILQVAVLVPWVMAAWIEYLKTMTGRDLVIFVSVASLQIFSGHPQLTYYTWIMLFGYMLLEKPSFQRAKLGFMAALLVALVTSVQTVPFIRFVIESTRIGQDFAVASSGSMHPLSFIRLFVPGLVGDLSHGTAWIQAGSMHGFVGFLPLLFVPFAWKSGRAGKFFVGVAIASLLMAMGTYTPVYRLAYYLIPGIALFREPGQFLFLWTFGVSVCVMAAADALIRKPERIPFMQGIGIVLLLTAGMVLVNENGIRQGFASWQFLPVRLITKLTALPDREWRIIMDGLVYNLSLFGLSGVLAGLALGRVGGSRAARALVLVILCSELWIYGKTNVTTISETTVSGWQEEAGKRIAFWKITDRESFRYYTDPVVYPYPYKKPFGQWNDPGESEWQFTILRPNLGMLYGLRAVDGYASMVPRSYQATFDATISAPTGVIIPSVIDPALARAGVRYIITKPNTILLADQARYTQIATDGDMAVYEDKNAIPITSGEENE